MSRCEGRHTQCSWTLYCAVSGDAGMMCAGVTGARVCAGSTSVNSVQNNRCLPQILYPHQCSAISFMQTLS